MAATQELNSGAVSEEVDLQKRLGGPFPRHDSFWAPFKAKAISWTGSWTADMLSREPKILLSLHIRPPERLYEVLDKTKPCHFFKLPPELRAQILGHFLPDKDVIACCEWYSRIATEPWNAALPASLRENDAKCHMSILAVNRQLYRKGTDIFYGRTYKIEISREGVTFLGGCKPSLFATNFPFHHVRRLCIGVSATDWRSCGAILLRVIGSACLRLSFVDTIQNLQIDFLEDSTITLWHQLS